MKKLFIYIIIAIALVGTFGFVSDVNAQTPPVGVCSVVYSSALSPKILPGEVTEIRCKSGDLFRASSTEADFAFMNWRQTSPPPNTTPPTPTTPTPTTPSPVSPTPTIPITTPQQQGQLGNCSIVFTSNLAPQEIARNVTKTECENERGAGSLFEAFSREADFQSLRWSPAETAQSTVAKPDQSELEKAIAKETCSLLRGKIYGCILEIAYAILFVVPAFILATTANFFNFLASITLTSELYTDSAFIPAAWGIVRDISNIFFILILLYVAIEMILGIGHGVKQAIAGVVIMAVLINFSMFFTSIVIDSSNMLALVFYNKISVTGKNGAPPPAYESIGGETKDLGGAIASAFNPTALMTPAMFERAPAQVNGGTVMVDPPLLSIIFVSAAVFLFAAYAFFIAGISFLGRMIELWILLIASPFAFMSFALPQLKHIEWAGWDSWLKKLFQAAFMAPIFMFFMYLIVLITQSSATIFQPTEAQASMGYVRRVLLIVIPAMIYLTLLLKAASFAKKGSGALGEYLMGGVKMATGLAIGAATGGAALALRGTAGAFMKGASTGDSLNQRFAKGEKMGMLDTLKGGLAHYGTFGALTGAQKGVGRLLNKDQHNVEHASHARHDLDEAAGKVAHGKKWNELNGEQRKLAQTNLARTEAMRALGFGQKTWNQLNNTQQARVTSALAVGGNPHTAKIDKLIRDSRRKQGIVSSVVQSGVTGSYDIRRLADITARDQTTLVAKMTSGITGAISKGMRGGLNGLGVNYGKSEGKFFKDLGSTITEALKSVKVNVDLSHVADVKKEGDHGGGHH